MSEIFTNNTNSGMDSLLNESLQETSDLRNQVIKLTNKNEEYQQKIHVLRRELDSTNAMYKEVKELLDEVSNQQSNKIDRKVHELTEKHNHERKCYERRIEELEEDLMSKTKENEELQCNLTELKLKLQIPPIQEEPICEDESELQENEITELTYLLQEKDDKLYQCEELRKNLQIQISELQDVIQSYKIRMKEKDQIIESTQEELTICRLELHTLKTTPVTDSKKGNSLFAEVEDRRQVMVEKMNAMRSSYLEMKRSFLSKENEIKTLKTERAALIRKWEESSTEAVEQETTLIDAYKNRIADLESKLKEEKKQKNFQNEMQQSGSNISYFQSLINSKKKEIEELRTQIENNAIRTLLEEEKSYKLGKRLRYWRYKAMYLEASLLAVQSQLQTDPNYSTIEILQTIKNHLGDKTLKVDTDIEDEIELSLKPQIVDETKVSLDSLIQPKPLFLPNLDYTLSSDMSLTNVIDDSKLETNQIITLNHDEKPLSKLCQTLNDTCDMSLTQIVEMENQDCTLKAEFEEDLTKFLPSSTSSCLQEKMPNMQVVPINNYSELNKENVFISGNTSILKSALSKPVKGQSENKKKALRFTSDTKDPKAGCIKRVNEQQKKYPVLFISSKSNT